MRSTPDDDAVDDADDADADDATGVDGAGLGADVGADFAAISVFDVELGCDRDETGTSRV